MMKRAKSVSIVPWVIVILVALSACHAGTAHQISWYSVSPSPPLETSHLDKHCHLSVYVLRARGEMALLWKADPVFVSNTPVVSSSPRTLRIRTVLIGPYPSCGGFSSAVSQDGTTIKGPIALALAPVVTDDWHARTFKQVLPLAALSGYYVLYEQRQLHRDDGSIDSGLILSWIFVSPSGQQASGGKE